MYKPDKCPIPTITLSRKQYAKTVYALATPLVLHGRKGIKLLPESGQEIGDNRLYFPDAPKVIRFRKRFSLEHKEMRIRFVEADNSDRFDFRVIVHIK